MGERAGGREVSGQSGSEVFSAGGVKVYDPDDPKVGVVGGRLCAGPPPAPSPAAGHLYNPYCPVSGLPALGRLEHSLIKGCLYCLAKKKSYRHDIYWTFAIHLSV